MALMLQQPTEFAMVAVDSSSKGLSKKEQLVCLEHGELKIAGRKWLAARDCDDKMLPAAQHRLGCMVFKERLITAGYGKQLGDNADKLFKWDFDAFVEAKNTKGKPLASTVCTILKQLNLINSLQLPEDKLMSFLEDVESAYHSDNPYHNGTHATDVVQTVACFLVSNGLDKQLRPLVVLVVILAAAVHDVGHPGQTNDFLASSKHPLAVMYQDSFNERGHLAITWELLQKHDFLAHLSEEEMAFVRGLLEAMVLGTDMKVHKDLLTQLPVLVEQFGSNLANWSDAAVTVFLSVLLHTADISNCAKPLKVSLLWAYLVNCERWLQSDQEAALGLTSPAFNLPANVDIPDSQLFFTEKFVKPCFEALASVAPVTAGEALQCLEGNLRCLRELKSKDIKLPLDALIEPD